MAYNGSFQAIRSVLIKLGIDPRERIDEYDQDSAYTACRSDELVQYFELYHRADLSADERAVLCCFLLQGLNDQIQEGDSHPSQEAIFNALLADQELHMAELAYWINTSDPDTENWWPITQPLLKQSKQFGA